MSIIHHCSRETEGHAKNVVVCLIGNGKKQFECIRRSLL